MCAYIKKKDYDETIEMCNGEYNECDNKSNVNHYN